MTGFVEQKSRLPTLAHTFEDSFETLAYAKSFSVLNGSTSISSSLVSDQKSDASKSGQGFTISSLLGERQY